MDFTEVLILGSLKFSLFHHRMLSASHNFCFEFNYTHPLSYMGMQSDKLRNFVLSSASSRQP